MNIRSVDLQVMIPRTTEVAKIQYVNDKQTVLQQQQLAEQGQQIVANRHQQVQATPHNEGGKVQREDHNQEKGQQHKRQQTNTSQANDASNEDDFADPILGHTIDIKT